MVYTNDFGDKKVVVFEPAHDYLGKRVSLTLGNEQGICAFKRGGYPQCNYCAIGDGNGTFTPEENERVIRETLRQNGSGMNHLVVFCYGNVLHEAEVSKRTMEIMFKEALTFYPLTIGLESRPEFVTARKLDELRKFACSTGELGRTSVEIIIGYETQDERIRSNVLHKSLSEEKMKRCAEMLEIYDIGLVCNVMIKPDVSMDEERGIEEALKTIQHLQSYKPVLKALNIYPTYVTKGMASEARRHNYAPPSIQSIAKILLSCIGMGPFYVGCDDENNAINGQKVVLTKREERLLDRFNATQDFNFLENI